MTGTPRSRYWAPRLALVAISMLAALAGAELIVRVFFRSYVDTARLRAALEQGGIAPFVRPSPDPVLYYELEPNLAFQHYDAMYHTDAQGRRILGPGDQAAAGRAAPPRPDDVAEAGAGVDDVPPVPIRGDDALPAPIRVAVVGDSTAFGWRVNYADAYAEQYRRLMERSTGRPVTVTNHAVPGYNAIQEQRVFETRVLPAPPDLLVLHYDHNDYEPTGLGQPPNYIPPEYGDNILRSMLIKLALRQTRSFAQAASLGRFSGDAHRYQGNYAYAGPWYDAHLEALGKLARQANAAGIPVLCVIFDSYVAAFEDYPALPHYQHLHAGLVPRLEAMGYRVLDLYPHDQRRVAEQGWEDTRPWWISSDPVDGHPTPARHAFIAEVLADYTRRTPALAAAFDDRRDARRPSTE